jgi:hypothetical protein
MHLSDSMTDNPVRSLVCLIEGESSLFRVEPTGNTDIIALKDLIKEKGINNAILAKDLTLWKVDIKPDKRDVREFIIGRNVPDSVKLEDEFATVSTYWPATTQLGPNRLQIIVELPSGKLDPACASHL